MRTKHRKKYLYLKLKKKKQNKYVFDLAIYIFKTKFSPYFYKSLTEYALTSVRYKISLKS